MDIGNFLGIGIVGAGLSIFMEWVKNKYGPTSGATKALVLTLSLVLGIVYVSLSTTAIFPTVLTILGAASTVYALFFH